MARTKKTQTSLKDILTIVGLGVSLFLGILDYIDGNIDASAIARIQNVLNHNVVCVEEGAPTHCEVR